MLLQQPQPTTHFIIKSDPNKPISTSLLQQQQPTIHSVHHQQMAPLNSTSSSAAIYPRVVNPTAGTKKSRATTNNEHSFQPSTTTSAATTITSSGSANSSNTTTKKRKSKLISKGFDSTTTITTGNINTSTQSSTTGGGNGNSTTNTNLKFKKRKLTSRNPPSSLSTELFLNTTGACGDNTPLPLKRTITRRSQANTTQQTIPPSPQPYETIDSTSATTTSSTTTWRDGLQSNHQETLIEFYNSLSNLSQQRKDQAVVDDKEQAATFLDIALTCLSKFKIDFLRALLTSCEQVAKTDDNFNEEDYKKISKRNNKRQILTQILSLKCQTLKIIKTHLLVVATTDVKQESFTTTDSSITDNSNNRNNAKTSLQALNDSMIASSATTELQQQLHPTTTSTSSLPNINTIINDTISNFDNLVFNPITSTDEEDSFLDDFLSCTEDLQNETSTNQQHIHQQQQPQQSSHFSLYNVVDPTPLLYYTTTSTTSSNTANYQEVIAELMKQLAEKDQQIENLNRMYQIESNSHQQLQYLFDAFRKEVFDIGMTFP